MLMEPKEKNGFYHHQSKGCNLVPAMKKTEKFKKRGKTFDRILHFSICTSHGVDVCRCGWQFTHHPVNQNC